MNTQQHPNRASRSQTRRVFPRTGFAAVLALAGASALAQTAPPPSTAPAADNGQPVQLSEYVVTGYSQSLAKSLQTKRASSDNLEVITAEDAGKFPDLNLAESLSHLPGITVDRLFGEGERVSILGTDPNLNRALLNGEPISSADWYILDNQSRQFNYLLLSPDVIGQAQVYKTWEAKLLEGSVGGTVIVNTRSPLDQDPMVFAGTVSDTYNDRSKKYEANVNAMFSWHNDKKNFGFLIGGEDQREYLRRDGVEALQEVNDKTLGVGGPVPGQPAGPWVTDEVVNTALFEQLRRHQGVNGELDFKPTDQLTISITGLYVKQSMDNMNFSYYMYPGDNWSGLPKMSNATVTGGALTSYTISSAPLVIDAFNRAAEIKTQDYNAKVDYKTDDFDLTSNVGYTRATGGTQHQFFGEYFVFANANIAESANQASFNVTGVPGADPTAANLNSGADFNAAGQPGFDYGNIASNPEVDDEKWVQFDATIPVHGALKNILAGLRFSDHKAGENGNVVGVPGAYENGPGTANAPSISAIGVVPAPSNYLSGLSGITPSMSQHIVAPGYGSVANFIGNLSAASLPGGTSGETLLNYFDSQPPSDAAVFTATPTFTIDERITAGYLEAEFGSGPLTGNVGARFVETTTTSASYNLSTPTPTLMSIQNTYDNVLPALNLVYSLTPDSDLRFGAAEVIARPNTAAEANYVQLYDASLTGIGGNANLKPYESTNYDAAYEYFFARNSYASVDLFYKDVSNYIINATNAEAWADYTLPSHQTATYQITRPSNGGSGTSEGAAFSLQYELPMGLGVTGNYTRLHTTSANGPLPYSSKNQINISPYFENKWGLLRLTYAWRDDYVFSSFNGVGQVWTVPFAEVDANAQINLTKNFSILLSGLNLADETYRQYYKGNGGPKLFADEYKFGRTYSASLHWNF